MKYDEAVAEAFTGSRMRHDGFQPCIYVEHVFSRGLLKCWPVASPDLEPTRSSCDFNPTPEDLAADWYELPIVRTPHSMPPGNPVSARAIDIQAIGRALRPVVATVGWGNPLPKIEPEVKSVLVMKDGAWVREKPLTPEPEASKWGSTTPKKEPGKWGI